jgi:hypothetical protein
VDEIVRDAGVLRLALEDRLEDRRALELIGIGLVRRRRRDVERNGVGDLRFVVLGIARRQGFHRQEIGLHAGAVIDLVVIDVHDGERVDIVALALRLGADRLGLFDGCKPEREIGSRRRCMRIVEQRHRNAPIGHAAFGVGFRDVLEYLLGLAIPERMLVAHRPIKAALRRLVARYDEVDAAEPLIRFVLRGCRLRGAQHGGDGGGDRDG